MQNRMKTHHHEHNENLSDDGHKQRKTRHAELEASCVYLKENHCAYRCQLAVIPGKKPLPFHLNYRYSMFTINHKNARRLKPFVNAELY